MAERNQLKNRLCKKCNDTVHGKASKLKEHAKTCDGNKPTSEIQVIRGVQKMLFNRATDEGAVLIHEQA